MDDPVYTTKLFDTQKRLKIIFRMLLQIVEIGNFDFSSHCIILFCFEPSKSNFNIKIFENFLLSFTTNYVSTVV